MNLASFTVMFLLFVHFGTPPAINLDSSWTETLGWAFAHALHWGKDIVFTYGPLGFLYPMAAAYMPIEAQFIVGQILMAGTAALIFILALRELRRIEFWLTWFFVLSTFSTSIFAADVLWMLIPTYSLVAIHLQIKNDRPLRASIFLASLTAIYCSSLWLIKVSSLPLVGIWLTATTLLLSLSGRRRAATLAIATFIVSSLLLWLICKQPPSNIWSYINHSLMIAAGYGTEMGITPHWGIDAVGLAVFLGGAVLAMLAVYNCDRTRNDFITFAALAAIFLLAWRTGYTRADAHVMIFHATTILLIPPLIALSGKTTVTLSIGLALLWETSFGMFVYFAISGDPGKLSSFLTAPYAQVRDTLSILTDPAGFIARREFETARFRQQFDLPDMRKTIGDRPVDMLGVSQSLVVVNDFPYAPRPIFQGYSAYSPELAEINVAALRARPFPAYMIVGDGPIDNRLWSMEDPLVFRELLQNYKPVQAEANYLLMERRQTGSLQMAPPAAENYRQGKLGDWVEIGTAKTAVLYLDAHPSLPGRIFSLLLREPEWVLEIETKSGGVRRYRLLRIAAQAGFVLSPLIDSSDAFLAAAESNSDSNTEIRRFRILPIGDSYAALYEDGYRYAITPLPLPELDADEKRLAQSIAYPGIESTVTRSEGNIHRTVEQGVPVTFAHAPSTLYFSLPPGRYRLTGEGGLQSSAITSPACAEGDGVEFRAGLVQADSEAVLLHIDPIHQPTQRGAQPFVPYEFVLREPGELQIRVDPGKNTICDWSYFRQVRIEPLAPERS